MNDRLLTDLYVAIETLDEAIEEAQYNGDDTYLLTIARDNIRTITDKAEADAPPLIAPIADEVREFLAKSIDDSLGIRTASEALDEMLDKS